MSDRVVLLHDAAAASGPADASDVLREAREVAAGLAALGYETATVPVGLDLAGLESALADLTPRVVFNLVESLAGRGSLIHVVPALLESLDIPYTGCSACAQWTTSNKIAAKRGLAAAGLAVPEPFPAGPAPWIVKSVWEHASLGLDDASVVAASARVPAEIARRARCFGGEWFAERYIAGRELNVAVIAAREGPRVLPVAEIRFDAYPPGKPRIVGYAAKWEPSTFEYMQTRRTFDVEPALAAAAAGVALECWRAFDLGGYARVDLRVDERGRLRVLEVNANPCLSADAGFAAALDAAGIAFPQALGWLIADALARGGGAPAVETARQARA